MGLLQDILDSQFKDAHEKAKRKQSGAEEPSLLGAFKDPQFRQDVKRGLLDSLNRGAVASTIGGPVDLATLALRPLGYNVEKPIGGSEWVGDKMQQMGLLGDTRNPIAEAIASVAVPGAMTKAGQGLFKAEQAAKPIVGDALDGYMTKTGMQLNIVPPEAAKKLAIKKSLPSSDEFTQAIANTPGASLGDDGLKMNLQRNQAPNQSGMPSVRGGVFYLPEGAAQAKHYSTGKNGYGGSEKITGETLLQNPLFVKGATGGKAPEAAFDQLLGKGAYQAMRSDALKAYGRYGASEGEKVEAVSNFLEKYAPELQDEAYNIVSNSKQGNQLAYALQEAAVGSKVRSAGHDAVLGYSKGKQGPFLSEVFDVRESHYPDKFGGYQVWDSLERNGQPLAPKFTYPQDAALETARQNGVKMLGLPENNTALDRAKALGFDTEAFHATPYEFSAFNTNPYRGSTFLASTGDKARAGAAAGAGDALGTRIGSDRILPVTVRSGDIKGLSLTDAEKSWFDSIPSQINEGDVSAAMQGKPAGTQWYSWLNEHELPDGNFVYTKKDAASIPYEQAAKTNRNVYGQQPGHYSTASSERWSAQDAKQSGKKGFLQNDEAGLSLAITDPSAIRSRFAAFDPARVNENDLLAGAMPFGLLLDPENRAKLGMQ